LATKEKAVAHHFPSQKKKPHPSILSQQAAALCQTDENQALSRFLGREPVPSLIFPSPASSTFNERSPPQEQPISFSFS